MSGGNNGLGRVAAIAATLPIISCPTQSGRKYGWRRNWRHCRAWRQYAGDGLAALPPACGVKRHTAVASRRQPIAAAGSSGNLAASKMRAATELRQCCRCRRRRRAPRLCGAHVAGTRRRRQHYMLPSYAGSPAGRRLHEHVVFYQPSIYMAPRAM